MYPVLPEGALVAVSPNAEVKNGDIAVIFVKSEISAYQCEVCVKLFHLRGAESQEAVLTSYNPAYKKTSKCYICKHELIVYPKQNEIFAKRLKNARLLFQYLQIPRS